MSIRSRILVVVLALVLVALTVLDVVSYSVVRDSLISRARLQLQTASRQFDHLLIRGGSAIGYCGGLPDHSFGALYSATGGSALGNITCPNAGGTVPNLPASLARTAVAIGIAPLGQHQRGTFATLGSYEVMAQPKPAETSTGTSETVIAVVGEPLAPVNSTLGTDLLVEIILTGSILLAVGVTAFFLVQLGLLPLEKMAATAGEIAAGDLSRRVDETDERTEVGRLGASLNVMLSRIEQVFRDKEASEARLRRFVADAGHELRTPLTSIRGYAELFGRGGASNSEDLSAALGRIESESARMSGLVEDLLLLARLDQGRPLEREPVDITTLAEDAARDGRVIAPGREISVSTSGDLVVVGDEARLRQVLANLVSNAVAHAPAGSPIEIRAERAGDRVRLQVVDHGDGIAPENRSKVFDRFWRADESRQRAKGGSGLGLSMVAAIVDSHGGSVTVTDTPGGGATFSVELPVTRTGPRQTGAASWPFTADEETPLNGDESRTDRPSRTEETDTAVPEPDEVAWVHSTQPE